MHVAIYLKEYDPHLPHGCFCENNPNDNQKYRVMIIDHPEDIELPLVYSCCEDCIKVPLKKFNSMLLAHNKLKKECNKAVTKMLKDRDEYFNTTKDNLTIRDA